MKRILLTLIYPFWFFLSKTWFGNLMTIPLALSPLPILIYLISPDIMMITGEEAEGVGIGLGILTLLCTPLSGMIIMAIGDKLEVNYQKLNYKTEMKYKMV